MTVQRLAPKPLDRYYAITIGVLVVPLSVLLANAGLRIVRWYVDLPANVSKPSFFIYWLSAVLSKQKITYLAAAFIGIVLLTPAIFQILHDKARYPRLAIVASLVSCCILGILVT